jgi:Ca-activated chloride channel family protein
MQEFRIDDVQQVKWLLLVAAAAGLMVYGLARRRRALAAFATANLLGVLVPDLSRGRQAARGGLLLGAMVCLVAALMGPRYGAYWEDVQQRQLDLMVCLDVSRSMLAEDAGMSRLERARDDIKRLLDRLAGGAIGLVAFAGKAELVCPLTDDFDFYRLALDDVGVHTVPLGGTNLGEAIASAVKAFGGGGRHQRAILLMTDGEDLGDSAEREARRAREEGVSVFTIGIGDTERGGLIPIEKDGQRSYMMYDGEQKWSRMDPARLKAVALAGGGEYQPSRQITPRQRTLEWIYAERLAPSEERTLKQKRKQNFYARFHWPAGLALVLLLAEALVRERASGASFGERREEATRAIR